MATIMATATTTPIATAIAVANDEFTSWQQINRGRKVTQFEMEVYAFVSTIPLGKVATYKQVAVAIGKPNCSRAVGTALAKNPFADPEGDFYVPCHRVINSNFKLGGFLGVTSKQGNVDCTTNSTINSTSSSTTITTTVSPPQIKKELLMAEGIKIVNDAVANTAGYRQTITDF